MSFLAYSGIVFDSINNDTTELEYTLRLRHEVGESDTWYTDLTFPSTQRPGPYVSEKYVIHVFLPCMAHL